LGSAAVVVEVAGLSPQATDGSRIARPKPRVRRIGTGCLNLIR
jgi:hypothetical protein